MAGWLCLAIAPAAERAPIKPPANATMAKKISSFMAALSPKVAPLRKRPITKESTKD
jgi:hypothetical protein